MDRCARQALAQAAREGRDCVLVQVERVEGSVPREAGAGMVVTRHSALGTVGGGHLELKSIALARQQLEQGKPGFSVRFPLGPSLGQCCGGVAYIRFDLCPQGKVPAGVPMLVPQPLFHLMLFGAGHVAQALVQVLATLDCAITWIDSREQQFPPQVPEQVSVEFSEHPADEVRHAPPGTFYLIMTHSHALDLQIVEQVMKRGDAGFLGLIGSKTKRVRFERRLADKGFGATQIATMTSPIGAAGITGKAPGVVAIAAAAQLLEVATRRDEEAQSRPITASVRA
ncbi:MAG TPA: xanthine dehydrogenase accessory protein XdhC [Burkholderiales bacterium]|nr:xanthine dehydrogenase accessory protein XdhC [Burkholderiales bacterium]